MKKMMTMIGGGWTATIRWRSDNKDLRCMVFPIIMNQSIYTGGNYPMVVICLNLLFLFPLIM